ncbi:hypothetical protein AYO21_12088 [Fonsecaea monophora]|uniref:Uncharacterized protein n=1 Tax=Fonsecaea monophora TaxID=254056 RepID=A0A177EPA3_9EURO|nr:hypothetical protein AYO21_12088 [Fonsecaea monophora]OAG33814.1 hypothetical protein AYO21_12088 [Fonsecaea monophora]
MSSTWGQGADSDSDDGQRGDGVDPVQYRKGNTGTGTGGKPRHDPTPGLAFLRSRAAARRLANSAEASKATPGATGPASAKPQKFMSATSNKYHKAVFPGMRVPVHMRKIDKGDRHGHQSNSGVTKPKSESVPVMSVQCPMPGGTVVTETTDPVQKVSWGPISRIEASEEARELISLWRDAVKDAKKTKAKGKGEDDSDDSDQPDKPMKTKNADKRGNAPKVVAGFHGGGGSGSKDQQNIYANDDLTPTNASQAETEATTDSQRSRGFLQPPPPTPPDTIFHKTHSVAAALSMPTLPSLHRISEPQLVEQYRLQHATDPEAFEKETRAIKKGLVDAKVARGGKPRLLKNEYTVELASREDAETAEKWVRDQGRTFGISDVRSRANSTFTASDAASGSEELALKMRGGEMEIGELATAESEEKEGEKQAKVEETPKQKHPAAVHDREDRAISAKPQNKQNRSPRSAKSAKYTLLRSKPTLRSVRSQVSRLDLSEHVSKITTYGSVRHQHSVKREAGDHGEKRTVRTWIEVTEVYEVPTSKSLTFKDVVAAVDEDAEDYDSASDGEGWESENDDGWSEDSGESDSDTAKQTGKKNHHKSNAKSKGKPKPSIASKSEKGGYESDSSSTSAASSTTSDYDSASHPAGVRLSGPGYHDPSETDSEALFHSLSRFGEVNESSISQVSRDLRALMAGLRIDGKLNTHES